VFKVLKEHDPSRAAASGPKPAFVPLTTLTTGS
jgi:hypothetical protein